MIDIANFAFAELRKLVIPRQVKSSRSESLSDIMQSSSYIHLNKTFEKTEGRNNNGHQQWLPHLRHVDGSERGGGRSLALLKLMMGFHWINAYAASIQK